MLDQRRRRWANIKPTLGQCIAYIGMCYFIKDLMGKFHFFRIIYFTSRNRNHKESCILIRPSEYDQRKNLNHGVQDIFLV